MPRPPKPKAEKYKSVTISVRPEDVDVLQRLGIEQFFRAGSSGGITEARSMIFDRGERPSVSSAIRYLIDEERNRRVERLRAERRGSGAAAAEAAPEDLLADDFVFGNPSTPKVLTDSAPDGTVLRRTVILGADAERPAVGSSKRPTARKRR